MNIIIKTVDSNKIHQQNNVSKPIWPAHQVAPWFLSIHGGISLMDLLLVYSYESNSCWVNRCNLKGSWLYNWTGGSGYCLSALSSSWQITCYKMFENWMYHVGEYIAVHHTKMTKRKWDTSTRWNISWCK